MEEKKDSIPVTVQPVVRPKTTRDVQVSGQSHVPKGSKPQMLDQTLDWKVKQWPGAEDDWWVVPWSDTMELLHHQFGEMTLRGPTDSSSTGHRQVLASDNSSLHTSSPLALQDSDIGRGLEHSDLHSRRVDERDTKPESYSMRSGRSEWRGQEKVRGVHSTSPDGCIDEDTSHMPTTILVNNEVEGDDPMLTGKVIHYQMLHGYHVEMYPPLDYGGDSIKDTPRKRRGKGNLNIP
ncbi:hypothetical protein E2320_003043 [Naja naja]|nr:hypothetical protein E2320_003043 [Naja naja]